MEQNIINDKMLQKISDFYKILSDYSRLKIVCTLLDNDELCVSDLVNIVGMSQTAVSYQLMILRQVHLVKSERKGKNVFYSIDDEHVTTLLRITIEHIKEKNDNN